MYAKSSHVTRMSTVHHSTKAMNQHTPCDGHAKCPASCNTLCNTHTGKLREGRVRERTQQTKAPQSWTGKRRIDLFFIYCACSADQRKIHTSAQCMLHIYAYIYMHTNTDTFITVDGTWTCACVYMHMCLCVCIRVCVRVCVCVYVRIWTCAAVGGRARPSSHRDTAMCGSAEDAFEVEVAEEVAKRGKRRRSEAPMREETSDVSVSDLFLLQCFAVCCRVLQGVAVHCRVSLASNVSVSTLLLALCTCVQSITHI